MVSRRLASGAVGVLATAVVAALPIPGLTPAGQYALATMAFAAAFWVTEALPLAVTALAIPVLLTVFGVFPSMADALAGFADPVIFLLFSGFTLAAALQAHDLDRRIALAIVATVGSSPTRLVFALMAATALLSMLVSNTATAAMMAPVALSVSGQAVGRPAGAAPESIAPEDFSNLEVASLLGVAYAASIGGVATIVGTPPNAIVVSAVESSLGIRITFVDWLVVGLPLAVVGLPIAWFVLARWLYPPEIEDVTLAREHARDHQQSMGTLTPSARRVVAIVGATAGLWLLGGFDFLLRPLLSDPVATTLFGGSGANVFGTAGHQGVLYFVVVGLLGVLALFATGSLEWADVETIDWGTLVLLGGGISLANALAATDATRWLADGLLGSLAGVPVVLLVLALVVTTVAVGELASNTAMAAILAPLLIEVGPRYAGQLGTDGPTAAVFLAVVAGAAASFGFALPVATPPNAIVFGTGHLTKDHMLRAGVALDAILAVVVTLVLFGIFRTVFPVVL